MKTKEEIIEEMIEAMPFRLPENIVPYIKEAMDIYRSQPSELPSDEEIEVISAEWFKRARYRSDIKADGESYSEGIHKALSSIASPLLASKDARIRELEQVLKECSAYHQGGHSEIGHKIRNVLPATPSGDDEGRK